MKICVFRFCLDAVYNSPSLLYQEANKIANYNETVWPEAKILQICRFFI